MRIIRSKLRPSHTYSFKNKKESRKRKREKTKLLLCLTAFHRLFLIRHIWHAYFSNDWFHEEFYASSAFFVQLARRFVLLLTCSLSHFTANEQTEHSDPPYRGYVRTNPSSSWSLYVPCLDQYLQNSHRL